MKIQKKFFFGGVGGGRRRFSGQGGCERRSKVFVGSGWGGGPIRGWSGGGEG